MDRPAAIETIVSALRRQVMHDLRRRGIVLGLSGGIDSSLVAALAVRAVGPERVLAVLMPERDSSGDALTLGKLVADHFRIPTLVEDVGPALLGMGCYARQEEAIRSVFPNYGAGWTCKLALPSVLDSDRINISKLTVRAPDGTLSTSRMPAEAYRQLIAATNMKQRVRKMTEYYHADRLAYAVAGTPNRLEYDQGFFVKQGDGAADVKPIAHLYKSQVYALAEELGVPKEIASKPPTTDTFSMEQTQEEFFFGMSHERLDLCLFAFNKGVAPAEVAPVVHLTTDQVERVYRDIEAKRRTTRYLHMHPLYVEPIPEVQGKGA
jgi:NAD+ synthase